MDREPRIPELICWFAEGNGIKFRSEYITGELRMEGQGV